MWMISLPAMSWGSFFNTFPYSIYNRLRSLDSRMRGVRNLAKSEILNLIIFKAHFGICYVVGAWGVVF